MPSLATLANIANIAGPAVSGLVNRNAANSATKTLAQGADTGINTIQSGTNQASGTLANIYKDQQNILQPYVDSGHKTLADIESGVAPGGGLADPFKWVPADLENDPIFQRRLKQGLDAIQAKGNAGGTRFSGASMKDFADYSTGAANDYLAQDYARQENTFRQNQKDRLGALMGLEGVDTGESNKMVDAGGTYGANLSKLQADTSKSIADLQTDKASAIAAGDIAKANQIQGMIEGAASGLQQAQILKSLNGPSALPNSGVRGTMASTLDELGPGAQGPVASDLVKGGATLASTATAPVAATLAGGGAAAGAAALPASMGAIAPLGATGALATPEIAAPALAPGAAGGAFPSAIAGFLTNPITIGVGAAIGAALIWRHTQVHPTASKFVDGYQKPFEQHLTNIVDHFDQALASGQLDKASAQQMRDQTAEFIQGFDKDIADFRTKGSKERTVADQAKAEMTKDFGANWEKVLQKMDSEIAGLQ